MKETLEFGGVILALALMLLVCRAGLVYSLRVTSNWWWAMAFAVEKGRAEFRRLNEETRKM